MSRKLLIIEDDSELRASLEDYFSREGFDVAAVSSAESALANLWEVEPDLIITDVFMAEMTGIELLERIRELNHPADVILMTGRESMCDTIRAMRTGAYDYLVKPLKLAELRAVVQRCFRERNARRPRSRNGSNGSGADNLIVGRSPQILQIWKQIGVLSDVKTPVLIRGDTGTGKELVARAVHRYSRWRDDPFVAINCTAVAETLLESELFGHLRGAFTGAVGDRRGRFELAAGGTIFLDEIGDTSLSFQAKLLRVIQEKEFYPVGSERPRQTAARVVAATHRPIEDLVEKGAFREDLYFRLRVLEIEIPPLRHRPGDIAVLAEHFVGKLGPELGKPDLHLPREVIRILEAHSWPGNVRELENTITRAMVLARGRVIRPEDISFGGLAAGTGSATGEDEVWTLEEAQWRHVESVLLSCGRNKSRAARSLGISRPRLDRILAKRA